MKCLLKDALASTAPVTPPGGRANLGDLPEVRRTKHGPQNGPNLLKGPDSGGALIGVAALKFTGILPRP